MIVFVKEITSRYYFFKPFDFVDTTSHRLIMFIDEREKRTKRKKGRKNSNKISGNKSVKSSVVSKNKIK